MHTQARKKRTWSSSPNFARAQLSQLLPVDHCKYDPLSKIQAPPADRLVNAGPGRAS